MRQLFLVGVLAAFFLCSATLPTKTVTAQTNSAKELIGLWEAKRRFGPDIRGTLFIRQTGGNFEAEISGRVVPAKTEGGAISFTLPDGKGKFDGKFDARRAKISGHWIQERTTESGILYASPVTLTKYAGNEWRGNVQPIDDTQTFFLMLKTRDDGAVGAFFRNPERNLGWFQFRADRIELEGNMVKLFAANKGRDTGQLLAEGRYDKEAGQLSIYMPSRGGTFDFQKVADNTPSNFYPRGRPTETYRYTQPPALEDGWQTATLEDVGLSRGGVEKFIQAIIDTPIDSANAQEDHGILIARHGKLVLEEYFHGENREKAHDTRSASKSVVSDLMGAAIQSGVAVSPGNFVYKVMNGGEFPADLEPRKRAMTVEHLLTMSSGLDCDDNDPNSPGYEDKMWEQTDEPDFYKWTMALKVARSPGEKAVYCSASPNLVGGILKRTSAKGFLGELEVPVISENLFKWIVGTPRHKNLFELWDIALRMDYLPKENKHFETGSDIIEWGKMKFILKDVSSRSIGRWDPATDIQ